MQDAPRPSEIDRDRLRQDLELATGWLTSFLNPAITQAIQGLVLVASKGRVNLDLRRSISRLSHSIAAHDEDDLRRIIDLIEFELRAIRNDGTATVTEPLTLTPEDRAALSRVLALIRP